MKQNFILVLLAFGIASCEYNNITPAKSSTNTKDDPLAFLEGRWIAEKDSFLMGSFVANNLKTDSDYYDFNKNGRLLIREGLRFDTATYALKAENIIAITFTERLIVNRLSGQVNKVSDSLLSLAASGNVQAPKIIEGAGKIKSCYLLTKEIIRTYLLRRCRS